MRPSTARLAKTPIRLADLTFPRNRVHIHRTRLAFVHLDNVLDFAKIDREGQFDGFLAAYLPDEVSLLLFRGGQITTAVAFTEAGRTVQPIATALKQIRSENERGELVYCDASLEQLAWMYSSCATPAASRFIDPGQPEQLLPALHHELFTGVLEIISQGRVNYFRFEDGEYVSGYFCGKPDRLPISQYVEGLFAPKDGTQPDMAAAVFPAADDLPEQASPAMIQTYRELFWSIADTAEREVPKEAAKLATKLGGELAKAYTPLEAIGKPLDQPPVQLVATPEELTGALAHWTTKLLEQLEIVAPGIAPTVVTEATREHRFMLQKAGFYDQLPWVPNW